jgi:hypothetical protein
MAPNREKARAARRLNGRRKRVSGTRRQARGELINGDINLPQNARVCQEQNANITNMLNDALTMSPG